MFHLKISSLASTHAPRIRGFTSLLAAAFPARSHRVPSLALRAHRFVLQSSMSKSTDRKPFRNPHNLQTKVCVVCNRAFTWRKKWEKCWDDVQTCSQRCKSERRTNSNRRKAGGGLVGAAAAGGTAAHCSSDCSDEEEAASSGHDAPTHQDAESNISKSLSKLKVDDSDDEEQIEAAMTELNPRAAARAQKKQAKAEVKAARRARRDFSEEALASKQKPCDLCPRMVDMLIRCQCDESQKWHMVCGKCWKNVSGGVPDGDADHPYYRYGGLWRNRFAMDGKKPSFGNDLIQLANEANEVVECY